MQQRLMGDGMSNLIRRQDAIDLIEQFYAFESKSEQIALQIAMRDLPSAQPEPKKGKWNRLDMDTLNCNKCGATFVLNQGSEKMHFCPNCGADMREVTT